MCAHFGWFNPELPRRTNRAKLFTHLARKAQAHGNKAFGVATKLGTPGKLIRYTGPASKWLSGNKSKIEELSKEDVIIGHTRYPTQGEVRKANTHPFPIGDWLAAHNGCISNSEDLMEKALHAPKGETDSEEALCYIVGEEFKKEAFGEIMGSYAIVALKRDGSELIIAVDGTTNFHIAVFGKGIVWSTSRVALKSSLKAVGLSPEIKTIENKIIKLPSWKEEEIDTIPSFSRYQSDQQTSSVYGKDEIERDLDKETSVPATSQEEEMIRHYETSLEEGSVDDTPAEGIWEKLHLSTKLQNKKPEALGDKK